jgi:hypothetical protein
MIGWGRRFPETSNDEIVLDLGEKTVLQCYSIDTLAR